MLLNKRCSLRHLLTHPAQILYCPPRLLMNQHRPAVRVARVVYIRLETIVLVVLLTIRISPQLLLLLLGVVIEGTEEGVDEGRAQGGMLAEIGIEFFLRGII